MGGPPGNTDLLKVKGTTNLLAGLAPNVTVNGQAVQGNQWYPIQDTTGNNIQGDFAQPITTNPLTPGLNAGVNTKNKTQYILSI